MNRFYETFISNPFLNQQAGIVLEYISLLCLLYKAVLFRFHGDILNFVLDSSKHFSGSSFSYVRIPNNQHPTYVIYEKLI